MPKTLSLLGIVAALSLPSAATLAADPLGTQPAIKPGLVLYDADGKALGRISRVTESNGAVVSVKLIVDEKFVEIPAATITGTENALTTSLKRADIRKL